MKRPNPEYTAGARAERKAIKAKIIKLIWISGARQSMIDPMVLVSWIDERAKRTAKDPGGAGRK